MSTTTANTSNTTIATETLPNASDQQDVLTNPSVLECPICNEQYGTEYNSTPRVLKCGHTYCTHCLTQLVSIHAGKRYGVKCAFCSSLHELARPDPKLIPINHAVLEIIKISDSKRVEPKVSGPQCEYRGLHCDEIGTWVCFDCNPTTHTIFCTTCLKTEHERGFEPVARHRRMLMAQVNNPHTTSCPHHPGISATLYSIKLQQFACVECETSRPEFAEVKEHFEPISEAVQRLRSQAKQMVKYSQDTLAKLNVTLGSISTDSAELGPSVESTKNQIQEKFSEIREIIQERQLSLMKHVQAEYFDRKQGMEGQLARIKAAFNDFSAAQGLLNSILGKHDVDFLLNYHPAFQSMRKVLTEEDGSLQRTVSYKDIPFYIPPSVIEDLRKMGAVGGGTVPHDVEVEISNEHCNLLQLKWQLPHYATEVQCYEIEYENLSNTNEATPGLKESSLSERMHYTMEPQSVVVPGNVLASYIQDISPGYTYRFRIRSQNVAGWGMWSKSVVAKADNFPIWIRGTKRIHRIRIAYDGMYRITAKGAKGADGKVHYGGRGAVMSGTFSLKKGDVLMVLVGTMSTMSVCNTGGGGGSFVALNELSQSNLLIAAGGGGGTRGLEERDKDGCDANLETSGTDGAGSEHGKGGTGGGPGEDADSEGFSGPCWGYGGAGCLQNSTSARSFIEGGMGGQYGGFGGGGAVGLYGGGGGGGYSGGGGGRGGGGGGSYIREDALNVRKVVGNEGNGEVEIREVSPPLRESELWSGEKFVNTNAAPVAVASISDGSEYSSQQSSSSDWQAIRSQHSNASVGTLPPNNLPQNPTPRSQQPFSSQLSKASTTSNTSSGVPTSSVSSSSVNEYPNLIELPPPTEPLPQPLVPIVASTEFQPDSQVAEKEELMPVVEGAIMMLDPTCALGSSNNAAMLQFHHPLEVVKPPQDNSNVLPHPDSGTNGAGLGAGGGGGGEGVGVGVGGGTNISLAYPQQHLQSSTSFSRSQNSNAVVDIVSPHQTKGTHVGSNADTGTNTTSN